jgi:zinc/manganese transport system substrate-binding protein
MSIFKNLTHLLRPHRHYPYLIGTASLVVTLWVSSLTATGQNSGSPKIVATILPMYLFTKGVAGSEGQVDLLVPPNTNIHNYQASPDNVRSLAEANILVKNGLGVEGFLDRLITNAGNTQLQQINASQGIEALKEEEHDHDHHESHGHSHEEGNPHVWLDPVLAQQQVVNIRDGLIAADPNNRQTYQANAAVYLEKLKQLDQQFKTRLSSVQGCQFISFHDAYPYLAQRYGLQQMAVVELPEDNLSPGDIQRVINAVKQYNVTALLSETGVDDSRLQRIADDTGLPVKALDPIESGSLDPQYYFTAMQKNLNTLVEVCQ